MKNKKFIAIIGDIIDSTNIVNRSKVQEELKQVLAEVNSNYKTHIASKWTITLGDEFQALLRPNRDILKMLDYISYKMSSIEIRFGIGLGEIYTDIEYETSIGADGPAYWNAREAIKYIHANNNYGNSKVCFRGKKEADHIINNLLNYTDWMKANWTDSQKQILDILLESNIYNEGFQQKFLTQELNISESAVSRRIKSSGIRLYLSSRNKISQELMR